MKPTKRKQPRKQTRIRYGAPAHVLKPGPHCLVRYARPAGSANRPSRVYPQLKLSLIAQACKIGTTYLTLILFGYRQPSLAVARSLAAAFDVSIEEIAKLYAQAKHKPDTGKSTGHTAATATTKRVAGRTGRTGPA